MTSIRLLYNRFRFRRQSIPASLATIPLRPHVLFSTSSPSPKVSYWYREHTSKNTLPVLFIHGIGVGLHTYTDFLVELNSTIRNRDDEDGNIGIIAVEILPISARLCSPTLAGNEMRDEIQRIVNRCGWDDFVLVGHSYAFR